MNCEKCKQSEYVEKIRAIIKKYDITCGEAIYQRDSINENAVDILGEICDIVGYYDEGDA